MAPTSPKPTTGHSPTSRAIPATPLRLIVRRVRPKPGSQLALFTVYDYHAFITDRDGDTLELEADHRHHAEIENTIRDLKYGVGLNYLPSARFGANAAWFALNIIAHNLSRWTSRLGLGEQLITHKTLRRRYLTTPGRITHSARRSNTAPTNTMAIAPPPHRPHQPANRHPHHLNPHHRRPPTRAGRQITPSPQHASFNAGPNHNTTRPPRHPTRPDPDQPRHDIDRWIRDKRDPLVDSRVTKARRASVSASEAIG